MATEAASAPSDATQPNAVLAALRSGGDHPLMVSFPSGAVLCFDRELRHLSAGGRGLADIGLSRELLEGRTIFEVFPEETAAVIEPLYRSALAGTSSASDVTIAGRIYLLQLAPVTDASGEVVAGLGFTQDVTESRVAERTLRESVERNRLTLEHAPIGEAIVELDGTWRQVNPAVTKLTEYTEEELLSRTFQDITHPDDLDLDLVHLHRLVEGEIGSYQIEKRYLTATGRTVWVLLSVALVRDTDGAPLYFVSQILDITEKKQAHEALQDLTGMLAHDLRTPAAVILGFAEILEGLPGPEMQEVRDHASRITAGARSMTELLDNALTATSLDAGKVVASPRPVSVRESVATARHILQAGPVSIETAAVDDVVAWVDPVHLDQVLTNLLTNAVKYGGSTVTVAAGSREGRVSVSVADDGPGVEPGFVPHLFDRFSRSPAIRTGSHRGSGLGLYIVQHLLAANDGTIGYATSPSGGAMLTIELPAAPDAPA